MSRLLVIAACAAVALTWFVLPASGARPLVTSVVDPWTLNGDDDSARALAYQKAQDTGATFVKVYVNWRAAAPADRASLADPRDPDGYTWLETDRQVEGARDQGLRPFLYVADAPEWARMGGLRPRPADLGDFFAALALRYPDVDHFQVWNEPNFDDYLTPQYAGRRIVSAPWYKKMVNAASAAVNSVESVADPRNLVIAGGTGPHGKKQQPAPLAFMRAMLCLRANLSVIRSCAPARFDIWAHHPYTLGGPTHSAAKRDDVSLGDLPRMRRVLNAAIRGKKIRNADNSVKRSVAFWVTEFSWDTKGPDPQGVPMSLHARWVSEALYRMWRAGVSQVTWFKLEDEPLNAPLPDCFYQSGFYHVSGAAKPSLQAFRFPFVAFAAPKRNRVSLWGRTPESKAARVVIQRKTARGWRRVARVRANHVGIFGKTLRRSWRKGSLRAAAAGEVSRSFSLRRPRDRKVYPFGLRTCL